MHLYRGQFQIEWTQSTTSSPTWGGGGVGRDLGCVICAPDPFQMFVHLNLSGRLLLRINGRKLEMCPYIVIEESGGMEVWYQAL